MFSVISSVSFGSYLINSDGYSFMSSHLYTPAEIFSHVRAFVCFYPLYMQCLARISIDRHTIRCSPFCVLTYFWSIHISVFSDLLTFKSSPKLVLAVLYDSSLLNQDFDDKNWAALNEIGIGKLKFGTSRLFLIEILLNLHVLICDLAGFSSPLSVFLVQIAFSMDISVTCQEKRPALHFPQDDLRSVLQWQLSSGKVFGKLFQFSTWSHLIALWGRPAEITVNPSSNTRDLYIKLVLVLVSLGLDFTLKVNRFLHRSRIVWFFC